MSQTKYSSLPVSSSTHEEWPPKVCERAKSSSRSTNACRLLDVVEAAAGRRDQRPRQAVAHVGQVSDTGIEPRVPQKRTRIAVR